MVQELLDVDNKNIFIDIADEVIQVPRRDEVQLKDPEILMKRLQDLQSPSERLRHFFWSMVNFKDQQTHESYYIACMTVTGTTAGWLFGGLAGSKHIHAEYARRHNASVFDGKYRAERHHFDNFVYRIFRRGMKYGVGTGLLCASSGILTFGSINYRNQLYYPDWAIGFATLGAITRCWLGLRGVTAGGVLGLAIGTFGYGLARGFEKLSGQSVTQLRYLNHVEYLRKREAKLERLRRLRNEFNQDIFSKS